jgi:hypothetical protein
MGTRASAGRPTSRPISFSACGRMTTAQCKKSTPTLFIDMYEVAGLNLKTAAEAEKASLRLRLINEARKGGMRFPA